MIVPLGFILTSMAWPAWMMLGYWFVLQFVSGLIVPQEGGGVAFWAHFGGFVAGAVLVKLFARPDYLAAHQWGAGARAGSDSAPARLLSRAPAERGALRRAVGQPSID